ncbi:DUF1657 domain-containing protein [Mesobacillus sp. S13]|uniref:DUF1657 domain-containing protein n=1 Tax=Mesobacillus sp. S13 TaxID=2880221 RepID=UPI00299EFF36|nr:DUF1657 domain-containing protein [Mesobacillus sp. S13]
MIKLTVASNINQLLSTIKGIEAQLSTMALNTNVPEASTIFHETMLIVGEIKTDLQDRKTQIEKEEPQYKS